MFKTRIQIAYPKRLKTSTHEVCTLLMVLCIVTNFISNAEIGLFRQSLWHSSRVDNQKYSIFYTKYRDEKLFSQVVLSNPEISQTRLSTSEFPEHIV